MQYLPVTLKTLNTLIKRRDFKKIALVDDGEIKLIFQNGKECTIDQWGRVIWYSAADGFTKGRSDDKF